MASAVAIIDPAPWFEGGATGVPQLPRRWMPRCKTSR